MIARRRILVAAMIGAGLALTANIYASPRAAVPLLVVVVLLLAIAVMVIDQPQEPRS